MLRSLRLCVATLILCVCGSLITLHVRADSRTDFLVKMLASSTQFRSRAQAALGLAANEDPVVVAALVKALRRDEHPAVRAASASALEKTSSASALAALKDAQRDTDPAVRAAAKRATQLVERTVAAKSTTKTSGGTSTTGPVGGAIYYVGVGVPASQSSAVKAQALKNLREHLSREVVQIAGVRLAPENESRTAAEKELRSQKLTGYFLDSSITNVETKPDGSIRAQVSIIVGTYPGRDMRAMLSGAATISGGDASESTVLEAVQAAYTGALRRLPQAMQAGLARAP